MANGQPLCPKQHLEAASAGCVTIVGPTIWLTVNQQTGKEHRAADALNANCPVLTNANENGDRSVDSNTPRWYLLRIKRNKEVLVRKVLSGRVPGTFLPLLRTTRNNWGRLEETVEPLFPGYMFALLVLSTQYHSIQWTPGITGVVCSGDEPAEIEPRIIDEIKKRAIDDIVTLWPKELKFGERVDIVDGPLRGLVAVFERYMSGQERVALLVELVNGARLRVPLPSTLVSPIVKDR
jgi:transcriptional antiterminator RfaH